MVFHKTRSYLLLSCFIPLISWLKKRKHRPTAILHASYFVHVLVSWRPMKHLRAVHKYFWKYRYRLGAGILFIFLSNYFSVLTPQVTGFVIDFVEKSLQIGDYKPRQNVPGYDPLVKQFILW